MYYKLSYLIGEFFRLWTTLLQKEKFSNRKLSMKNWFTWHKDSKLWKMVPKLGNTFYHRKSTFLIIFLFDSRYLLV